MFLIIIGNVLCDYNELFLWYGNRRKAYSLISSRDHCQRSLSSLICGIPRAGFEPTQNLSSGLVEWSWAVVITTMLLKLVICFKEQDKISSPYYFLQRLFQGIHEISLI